MTFEEALRKIIEKETAHQKKITELRLLLRKVVHSIENEHLHDEVMKEVQSEDFVT